MLATAQFIHRLVAWTTDTPSEACDRILSRRIVVSQDSNEFKRDLECLRLASDFIQMSHDTLNPELRAHCARMASFWSGQAEQDRVDCDSRPAVTRDKRHA